MDPRRARRVLAELAKRRERSEGPKYLDALFPQQLAFIQDPSRTKAALCSRRAGKSYSACAYLLSEAEALPDCVCVYIALTRISARRILWAELKRFNNRFNLGIKFNNVDLEAVLPNGSQIWLSGADNEDDIEKLRGSKYRLAVIDEAASFRPYISKLVEDVLEPAMIDQDGTICLIGTPGPIAAGYFFDVTTGRNPKRAAWPTHRWTLLDNPHIPDAAGYIERKVVKNRWPSDHPTLLREWRGQWVRDEDSLVYKYLPERNGGRAPALPDLEYVLGMDFGFEDSTAWVVLAHSPAAPDAWVVESFKKKHCTPSRVAEITKELARRYPFTVMVGDSGGFGKGYVEEMRLEHGLPVKPAKKTQKRAYIEYLNGSLLSGTLKIDPEPNQALVEELQLLQWADEDHLAVDEEKFDDHLCDALLYGWRACKAYLYEEQEYRPAPGTAEALQAEADEIEARLEAKVAGEAASLWWES